MIESDDTKARGSDENENFFLSEIVTFLLIANMCVRFQRSHFSPIPYNRNKTLLRGFN